MKISQLRKRSNQFRVNLDLHIGNVVDHNEKLLQLNKAQLKSSQTSKGTALINSLTGSATYSPAYAKFKGYRKPDLFLTGKFYKEMDILFNEPNKYLMTSYVPYTKHLITMYGELLFGIRDRNKAYAITTNDMTILYKSKVLA